MDKDYKYTNDGKKVVVVGNLNSQEIIVQEIFCANGSEFPSGENFIVKSLHDEPCISWEEKRLKEIKDKYTILKPEYEEKINQLQKSYHHESKTLRLLIKDTIKYQDSLFNEGLKTLMDFIGGSIKFIVIPGYDYKIISFMDAIAPEKPNRWSVDSDRLKLVSLYGRSDGSFEWSLGQYSDDSGSSKEVIPCESYERAKEILSNVISDKISDRGTDSYMIKAKEEYNLSAPSSKDIKTYYAEQSKSLNDNIEKQNKKLKEDKEKLKEYKSLAK